MVSDQRPGGAASAPDPGSGGLYPIRTVAALTGVNPVTLRAWERRHNLIVPQRTAKGHRLYNEADIQRVHRVLELLEQGVPISQTRRLLEGGERRRSTYPVVGESPRAEAIRRQLSEAVTRLDEQALEETMGEALASWPMETVMGSFVLPHLRELGALREGQPTAEAGFALLNSVACVRLATLIHQIGGNPYGGRLLLASAAEESPHAELLTLAVLALRYGYRVVLLSAGVTPQGLAAAARQQGFRAVIVSADTETSAVMTDAVPRLIAMARCPVFVTGQLPARDGAPIERAGATPLTGNPQGALDAVYAHIAKP